MGYSVGLRVSSKPEREKMLSFMEKHYRRWSAVSGTKERGSTGDPTDDLSYDSSSKAIGCDYASHVYGWDRLHIFSMVRWMALKVGDRKARFKKDDVEPNVFSEPVPFIVYDGYQSWPILVVKSAREALRLPKGQRWCATDRYGIYFSVDTSESLVTGALEDLTYRVGGDDAFLKIMERTGGPPKDPKKWEAWSELRKVTKREYARPEVARTLPIMRKEFARLDRLWKKYASL